jgi:Protein of unknown function (DUF2585)
VKPEFTTPLTNRRWLFPVVVIVSLVPLTALALWAEGRLFFCSCGEFDFWVGDTCSSQNSQQLFDPYSFTHILHGFLLFWLIALVLKRASSQRSHLREQRSQSFGQRGLSPAWQLAIAAILESLWEVLENTNFIIDRYRAQTAALGYTGDTVINSIGDLSCAIAGFLIARRLGWRRSLLAFLLVELVIFLWIRDSLLLQILMLIYPVNALKLLQLCR